AIPRREGAETARRSHSPVTRSRIISGKIMKQLIKLAAAAALGALASGTIVYAQAGSSAAPKARVALYRAAPGQQVALLKYFAAHTDTYTIGPVTPAQYLAMAGQ